ncbi:hypothetical protein C4C99_RS18795 [Vibrio parahaemolyticus]|uniref:hypothetical protein n=1 Tax=Vibrio parahaemolyticus TaxID=670 RepID=UPI0005B69FB5|nr:hypothetical protein [Vibrio parahaemolyticus]KIT49771.1 hypothetical protein H334_06195 [Vibrio parahaemolyticus 901128]EGQ8131804.1 hypothetical protein [Vibrio parahaemolyticus]EGQ8277614.1 hypothetical protein [Vibrio parahaemolyticus]EGQ8716380.1 hypothetical protein [Vibrio parahaemolyticus]EGQ8809770.1 hypothetical protein [Vibrio parahaemolyticus]
MNCKIETIEAAAVLSRPLVECINRVVGHVFDNGDVEIEFHGVQVIANQAPNSVRFKLSHQGIEAQGFITAETVQRLLAVDIQHLDQEYVSYLLAQRAAKYGISNVRYEETSVSTPKPLMSASFRLGEITVKGALSVPTLFIEDTFLRPKKQVLSGQLKLSVSWAPFETALYAEEITALTAQDLVLVFPK